MANTMNSMWVKILASIAVALLLLVIGAGATSLDKKLDKDVYELHEKYQAEQFGDIKSSLVRIENKP